MEAVETAAVATCTIGEATAAVEAELEAERSAFLARFLNAAANEEFFSLLEAVEAAATVDDPTAVGGGVGRLMDGAGEVTTFLVCVVATMVEEPRPANGSQEDMTGRS